MPSKKDFPEHIAIIMDGNGRWAKRRWLPRSAGHLAGAKNIASVVRAAKELGVKILTVYAFSTENWKRSAEEVEYLMRLIPHFTKRLEKAMMKENVRLRTIGRTEDLPEFARKPLLEVIERTSGNDGFTLNVALSYGGRAEIVDAVEKLLADRNRPEGRLTEAEFAKYLYAPDLPDPDLMIRTSGELRLSNFLLWELSYSELYVTETHWPDFNRESLMQAIEAYQGRDRRFGGIKPPDGANP